MLAFLWLALAPYLIWKLESRYRLFIGELKRVAKNESFLRFVEKQEQAIFSTKAYLCGIPIIVGVGYLAFVVFAHVLFAIQILIVTFLSVLFFLSGLGFWGVIKLIMLTQDLKRLDIDVNPFHPDKFGGLGFVGSLAIEITLGFSTGSLVLPLAMEYAMNLSSYTSLLVAQILISAYVLMILVSFFVLTLVIHSWLVQIRNNYLMPIADKMKRISEDCQLSEEMNENETLQDLFSVYDIAARMKEWPFDFEVIIQLVGSILLPIIIVILQLNLGLFG